MTDSASLLDAADELLGATRDEVRAEESEGKLTLYHDKWPVVIGDDYSDFIRFFGYDPAHWVVENQGTMSKWQQSKGNKDGSRDVIWLYSYKGVRFARVTEQALLTEDQFTTAVKHARKWSSKPLTRRTLGAGLGTPCTYVSHQGDTQAGKGEGGGIEGLNDRLLAGLESTIADITYHRNAGRNIEAIADLNSGDIVENIFGHYETQTMTTATMRAQYAFAVESEIRRIRAFAEFGLPIVLPRTPSNHGEHRTSVGGRAITTESDNLDLQIAETVKRVLQETSIHDQLEWAIPHDDPMTRFVISDVACVLSHGHKLRDVEKGITAHHHAMVNEGFNPKIFFLGHLHHFFTKELGCGTSVIQTSALDGGSPYFFNMTGKKNTPGLVGLLVSPEFKLGYGYLNLL